MSELLRVALQVAEPEFLRRDGRVPDERDVTGRGNRERADIDGEFWRRFLFTFGRVEGDFVAETLGTENGERAVFGPAVVFDGAIEAGSGEIVCGATFGGHDPKIVRDGAVVARGGETDPFARRRHTNPAKRTVGSAEFFLCAT